MKFFWIINGRAFKQLFLIITAAFLAAAIAYFEEDYIPAVFPASSGPEAIYRVETDKKQLALTFDISWGDVRAESIIQMLNKHHIQATFFVNGVWAKTHPEIIRKLVEGNHEIGSHGYQHKSYTTMEKEEIRKDILLAQQAIEKSGANTPSLLRPPNGSINKTVLEVAEALNYKVIHWSVNPKDWKNPGVATIAERVISSADPGDIVLLHASDSAKQTQRALGIIIEQLDAKGYSFVTVSRLISNGDVKTDLVQ